MSSLKLSELRSYVLGNLGLNFSENQEGDLYRKMGMAARSFNFDHTDDFIGWILKQSLKPEELRKLATFLTIGETYFFRERRALNYLEYKHIPELIKFRKEKNKTLNIWSAGCASGEEAYSIAILLKRIIPDIESWDITILATDINPQFIKKAKKGIYSRWSFRGLSDDFKKTYFKQLEDGNYKIKSSIRKMVKFSYLNLNLDSYPLMGGKASNIDIILCRNVLIYFSAEGIEAVSSKFYNSLSSGGVLLVSPVEASSLISSKFGTLLYDGATVYTKGIKNASKLNQFLKANPTLSISAQNKLFTKKKILFEKNKPKQKTPPFDYSIHKKKPSSLSEETKEEIQKPKAGLTYQELQALYRLGSIDKLESRIQESLESKYISSEQYYLLLARIKADKGLLEESEALCLNAIKKDKTNSEIHYFLSTVLNEQGKEEETIRSLSNTLFLDPDNALAYFMCGNILLKRKDKSGSKKHFRNALKCLEKYSKERILDESEGLTAGRLTEIINEIVLKKI